MKTIRLSIVLVVVLAGIFPGAIDLLAQNPTADLEALVGRIEAKRRAGKVTELELAREINEFSDLLNKYRGQKTNEVAMILFVKAMLYVEALHDLEMGVNLLEQVKADFPRTGVAQAADDVIRQIRAGPPDQGTGGPPRGARGG